MNDDSRWARIEAQVDSIHHRIDEVLERLSEQQGFDKQLAERRFPGIGEARSAAAGGVGGGAAGYRDTGAPLGGRVRR